jgi:hypothetical protein
MDRYGKKTGGRQKGTLNKKSVPAEIMARELGIDPLRVLLLFTGGRWKDLGYDSDVITPDHRINAAKEAVKYIYFQRKTVELDSESIAEGFKVIVEDYTKK